MFRIQMFPAREGDCLILTYGQPNALRRIMIDGGRKTTYANLRAHFVNLPQNQRAFELLIISHIDRDHLEGILELFKDQDLPVTFKEVWFNAYHHLNDGNFEDFSPVQGENLSAELVQRVQTQQCEWNASFGPGYQKAVALPSDDTLLDIDMGDGMTLTLLSPSREKMEDLIPTWETECKAAGMVAGAAAQNPLPEGFEDFMAIDIDALAEESFEEDPSKPNGSSIAVLAQYNGKSALFSGDAHADLLEASISQLHDVGNPLEIDVFKLSHHGSRRNVSKSLLQGIRCKHYLVSTNGSYFDHPDPVAMSRLIKYGGPDKHIWFNYSSDETKTWDVTSWKQDYDYELHYPADNADGYQVINLE